MFGVFGGQVAGVRAVQRTNIVRPVPSGATPLLKVAGVDSTLLNAGARAPKAELTRVEP